VQGAVDHASDAADEGLADWRWEETIVIRRAFSVDRHVILLWEVGQGNEVG
jgi:hypothetical protein